MTWAPVFWFTSWSVFFTLFLSVAFSIPTMPTALLLNENSRHVFALGPVCQLFLLVPKISTANSLAFFMSVLKSLQWDHLVYVTTSRLPRLLLEVLLFSLSLIFSRMWWYFVTLLYNHDMFSCLSSFRLWKPRSSRSSPLICCGYCCSIRVRILGTILTWCHQHSSYSYLSLWNLNKCSRFNSLYDFLWSCMPL